LLQQTQRRVSKLLPAWRTILVLTAKHEPFYAATVKGISTATLVIRPANRGTAPAVLNTVLRVREMDRRAIVACFPSDHHFSDDATFVRHIGRTALRPLATGGHDRSNVAPGADGRSVAAH
jgi:mannose-1-phosphate guanylyltransferase